MIKFSDFLNTLRFRVFLLLFLSLALFIFVFSFLSISIMDSNVESVMVNDLIKSAELVDGVYQSHLESFFDSGLALSKDKSFIDLVSLNTVKSRASLKENLLEFRSTENLDILTLVDLEGRVIVGANDISSGTLLKGIIIRELSYLSSMNLTSL